MAQPKKFKQGDIVVHEYLVRRGRDHLNEWGHTEVMVLKVGRKYVSIPDRNGFEARFEIKTGRSDSAYPGGRIWTREEWAEQEVRRPLVEVVSRAVRGRIYHWWEGLSTDDLKTLAEIMGRLE